MRLVFNRCWGGAVHRYSVAPLCGGSRFPLMRFAVHFITRTLLRVSSCDCGADVPDFLSRHGGAAISTAIEKYIFHTSSPLLSWLFDHKVRFAYRTVEHMESQDEAVRQPLRKIFHRWFVQQGRVSSCPR